MAKKDTTRLYFGIVVAFILVLVVAPPFMGAIIGDGPSTSNPVNVNTFATWELWTMDAWGIDTKITTNYVYDVTPATGTAKIQVRLYMDDNYQIDEGAKVKLVVNNNPIAVSSSMTSGFDILKDKMGYYWDIVASNCPLGKWPAWITVMGESFNVPIGGNSHSFFLENGEAPEPLPPIVTCLTQDTTVDPYDTITILWEYEYAGTHNLVITDDREGSSNEVIQRLWSLPAVLEPTQYSIDYYALYSGTHIITLEISPVGSVNEPASDSMILSVSLGGAQEEFPPSVDRCDIYVDALVVNTGVQQSFTWNLFSEFPSQSLSQTVIDGNIYITLVVSPTDSLSDAWVKVDDGSQDYDMDKLGASWKVTINTDNIEDGIHTIDVWGVDSNNGYPYLLGTFTIAVRIQPMNPFLLTALMVGALAVGIVMVFRFRTKGGKKR